jgi:DNA mismatch repair protein MutS
MTTPLRRQYLDIKRRYPHAILFFRMGDFYETFDEDAEVVARELEITLTSRPVSKGERVPLAGIPYHALDSYLGKLIAKGYKVAICEQTTAPEKGKKIVDRSVVRVVTPGTLVEDNLLPSAANNYLAALVADGDMQGLAWCDISTGEFDCLQGSAATISAELARISPAELLLAPGMTPDQGLSATLSPLARFDVEQSCAALLLQFGVAALDGLGLAGQRLAAASAGVVIEYLAENQKAVLGHIVGVGLARGGEHMLIDAAARRNLEIFEPLRAENAKGSTLLGVLDETETPMGGRLLRRWLGKPLLDPVEISRRQDGVQLFAGSAVRRGRVRQALARVPDLERVLARVSAAAASSLTPGTPRDLLGLRRGLDAVPELRMLLEPGEIADEAEKAAAESMLAGLHHCSETAALVAAGIADDPGPSSSIRSGFSEELDRLRMTARNARQVLAEIESRERDRTGIRTLKVGYNRVFGYYLEVSKANAGAVPEDYQRKQTLVNGERYTTPELQEHEYRVLHAHEMEAELESALLRQICTQVAAEAERILATAAAIAVIDVSAGLAEVAARCGYTRPIVDSGDTIIVRDGRHPVVERMLPEGTFVPNDVFLSSADAQVIILTGPNMAGKSTYLRTVALLTVMAQIGSFVPAREARIGVVDRLFSRVGALDDIAAGHSTFMVEMLETAAMLNQATERSLLIFDEIGRGTSTYDGMAIARAVAEFVHNRPDVKARTLFATHYHELTALAETLPRVRNFNVAVAEENGGIVFLHRILPGGADRSYGVHVAQLAGLPRPVLARAQELLEELEAARSSAPAPTEARPQLSLFARGDDALRRELADLDVNSMTPLEAIQRLYELSQRAAREAERVP